MFALERFNQARAAENFGVKTFCRQIKEAEVGGMGRRDVAIANVAGFAADAVLKIFGGLFDADGVAAFGCVNKPFVVFFGKFGVDGEPDDFAVVFFRTRESNSEFDELIPGRFRFYVTSELLGSENLFKQIAELNFAPRATGFNVGENAFEIADTAGESLHFAETFVDLLEAVADEFERFAEAAVERALELFVDGLAHFFELGGVVGLEIGKFAFNGKAKLVGFFFVFVSEDGELIGERVELLLKLGGVFGEAFVLEGFVGVERGG